MQGLLLFSCGLLVPGTPCSGGWARTLHPRCAAPSFNPETVDGNPIGPLPFTCPRRPTRPRQGLDSSWSRAGGGPSPQLLRLLTSTADYALVLLRTLELVAGEHSAAQRARSTPRLALQGRLATPPEAQLAALILHRHGGG